MSSGVKTYLGSSWGPVGVGVLFWDSQRRDVLLYQRSGKVPQSFTWSYVSGACCQPTDEKEFQHFEGDPLTDRYQIGETDPDTGLPNRQQLVQNAIRELVEEMGPVVLVPDLYRILDRSPTDRARVYPGFVFTTFVVDVSKHPQLSVLRRESLLRRYLDDENVDLAWVPISDLHGAGDQVRPIHPGAAKVFERLWGVPVPQLRPPPRLSRAAVCGWHCLVLPAGTVVYHGSSHLEGLQPDFPTYFSLDVQVSLKYCRRLDCRYLKKYRSTRDLLLLDLHDRRNVARLFSIIGEANNPRWASETPAPHSAGWIKTVQNLRDYLETNDIVAELRRTLFGQHAQASAQEVSRDSEASADRVLVEMLYAAFAATCGPDAGGPRVDGYISQHAEPYWKVIETPVTKTRARQLSHWGSELVLFDLRALASAPNASGVSGEAPSAPRPRSGSVAPVAQPGDHSYVMFSRTEGPWLQQPDTITAQLVVMNLVALSEMGRD